MSINLKSFLASEDGSSNMEWMLLASGALAMSVGIVTMVGDGAEALGTEVTNNVRVDNGD